jgi:hypothetical protein
MATIKEATELPARVPFVDLTKRASKEIFTSKLFVPSPTRL